jgi:hypothetical protein
MTDKPKRDDYDSEDMSDSINDIFTTAKAEQRWGTSIERIFTSVFVLCVSAIAVASTAVFIRWML